MDTKRARGTYGPRTFKRRQRRRIEEIKSERKRGERGVWDIRYRWEREYRVLQTSRQLPASGYTVPGINMRLTEWDRCSCCRVNRWPGRITSHQPYASRLIGVLLPFPVYPTLRQSAVSMSIAKLLNYSLYYARLYILIESKRRKTTVARRRVARSGLICTPLLDNYF